MSTSNRLINLIVYHNISESVSSCDLEALELLLAGAAGGVDLQHVEANSLGQRAEKKKKSNNQFRKCQDWLDRK
jgi:hypothetical protein